jgi:hypothetical protein
MEGTKLYLFAARDITTGKLVNDITNPGHKFWEKQGSCIKAIEEYNNRTSYYGRRQNHGKLELVTFELKELH